ncbi:MAG: helix-turn-helix domain-containing protein [Micropepsaceae bacterium]
MVSDRNSQPGFERDTGDTKYNPEHVRLGARIREIRKGRGMTAIQLSNELGVSQPAISQWETGKEPPGRDSLTKLSKVLGVSVSSLLDESDSTNVVLAPAQIPSAASMNVDVPVFGTVVGGASGDFSFNGQVVDYVRRPPGVAKLRNMYALWIVGDSMSPWNRSGDLIYVSPARPPVHGDHVVIEFVGGAEHEPGTAMVKLLVAKTATQLKLRQYNPDREFTLPLSRVKAIHKVLSLRDLLGV